jgi:hypothetical protein
MATKKKTKKKSTGLKRTTGRKVTPAKKLAQKRKNPRKTTKRKTAPNTATKKTKGPVRKVISRRTAGARTGDARQEANPRDVFGFSQEASGSRSGEQSGDLQGLSNVESADSERVDELVEEGNAFEAGVVSGVEEAGRRGVRAVRTREVPEDDVPGEYLDEE